MPGPFLNPSARPLTNPFLTSSFNVIRRAEVVSNKGVSTVPSPVTSPAFGVICAAHPNDLRRLDDQDFSDRHISVVTKFRLQMTSPGFKPDLVVWQGDNFVVKLIEPYPEYGPGWVQAVCGSIDLQDSQLS